MTWRITDWAGNFENNRTRSLKVMLWVPIPVNLSGSGYAELVSHPSGAAHLGVWLALVEVAARCEPRGTLVRGNGTPHDPASLSLITRLPASLIAEALPRLQLIGWIEELAEGAGKAQEGAAEVPQSAQEGAAKLPYRKEGRKEGQAGNCDRLNTPENLLLMAEGDEFRRLYPAHRLDDLGAGLFLSTDAQGRAGILERLRVVVKSDDWTREGGRFVPKASKWITDGAPAPAAAKPAVTESTMDPETRRRIKEAGL